LLTVNNFVQSFTLYTLCEDTHPPITFSNPKNKVSQLIFTL